MKIVALDTWTVSVPYVHDEISSRVARSGVTDTVVRLTADNGLIGWGECTSGPDAASIEQAVQSARPLLLGRDPWQSEAIARDFFRTALWDLRAERQLRFRRHRPGPVGLVRQGMWPAALSPFRRLLA